jgi:hypothetical protein
LAPKNAHFLTTALRDRRGDTWGYQSRAQLAATTRPRGAIVFVHGFKPWHDAVDTWMNFPTELGRHPRTAGYDLYFFGHDARYSAATSAIQFREFLKALAENPAAEVMNPSLASGLALRAPATAYRHIVICAHSLGSIVVRLALLESVDHDDRPLRWLKRVRLVLFGPAHTGANILGLFVSAFAGLPVIPPVHAAMSYRFPALKDLTPKSSTLENLWNETRRRLDLDPAAFEHLRAHVAHGRKDKIVEKGRFVADHPARDFATANHLTVCKPNLTRREPLDFLLEHLP